MFAYDTKEEKCFVPQNKILCFPISRLSCMGEGISEHPLIMWAMQFGKKDKIFLDIGAHTGTYSVLLSDVFKEVHSYEPDRFTYYGLCASVAFSGKKNVFCHNLALGSSDQNKEQKLKVISLDGGGSSILDLPRNAKPLRVETVKLSTLDSHLAQFSTENSVQNDIGFVKIDVEGNEYAVLEGAKESLKASGLPPILFEANEQDEFCDLNKKTFEILISLGYKIFPIGGYPNMFLANIS